MKPQAFTEFQPLEEVLLGRCYNMNHFDSYDIPFSPTTKRLMTHLLDETEEDFQGLKDTLKKLNVKVRRPSFSAYQKGFGHRLNGAYLISPRDDQIVIDNKIVMGQYHTSLGQGFITAIEDYKKYFLPDPAFKNIICSSIVRLGEHIIVDSNVDSNTDLHASRLKKYFEPLGYKIIYTKTHDVKMKNQISHADAVFAILKPGLILLADNSSTVLPELQKWDIIRVSRDQKLSAGVPFQKFRKEKEEYSREVSYAFEDAKYNDERWLHFLNTWFSSLMGYAEETYFDVNCLVVDEENVIFSSYNKEIFKQLEKRGINPIVCRWRHRLFWDGGIHCITLDLKRKGNRERYL